MAGSFEPSIPEFYANKNILITGGTGFIGKALVEKLLRSCPNVGNIYVLMRPKRGKSISERVQIFAKEIVFERVLRERPDLEFHKKIIPILGDCQQLNLGLSQENRDILTNNVNIIFHGAASVRFDDPLKDATLLNIRGTRDMCQLALATKNLDAFIHISTAYVNCDHIEAEEKFYPRKMDWRKLIEIAENFDSFSLNILENKILDTLPNTYTFTKNVAENAVCDILGGIVNCQIIRPSVVFCSMLEEPCRGWLDNMNGPTGILVASGTGILRSIFTDPLIKCDYIPVDVVVKSLIVSAWDLAIRSSRTKAISPVEVAQCSAYKADWLRISSNIWSGLCCDFLHAIPLDNMIMKPNGYCTKNYIVWYVRTIFTMVLPAIIIDAVTRLTGNKPRLLKIQRKMFIAQICMKRFMQTDFELINDNLLKLQKRIQDKDKKEFDYEFQDFPLLPYAFFSVIGTRRFVMKSPDSTVWNAQITYKRIEWLTEAVYIVFWIILFNSVYKYIF